MSSKPHAAVPGPHNPEIIPLPFGKVPEVTLAVAYRELADLPSSDELNLAFQMLDALLLTTPFDQWEN